MRFKERFIQILKFSLLTGLYGVSLPANSLVNFPNSPLFISTAPQANIMFAVDDSGSMDWEVLLSDGALVAHPTAPTSGNLDLSPNDDNEDREFCAGYNVLAYDPAVTYTPWVGEDSAGVPFGDQSPTAARNDPYDAGAGTTNLTSICCGKSMIYGVWDDINADQIYDAGECPTALGASGAGYGTRVHNLDSRFVFVNTLPAAEQTNFANWYSYYRKREFVMKRAMSEIIEQSSFRLGLATLHNHNNVGTPIRDMTITANKENIEDEMFSINSNNGTPLRRLLDNVGKYFDDTDGSGAPSALGFTEGSPILPVDEGGECQQNYAVLMSDGYWNGSNAPGIGNEDGDNNSDYDGGPHADAISDTLADVAMKYYEKDLSSLDDNVPVIEDTDDNTSQHLVTYSVSFGLDGTGITDPVDHENTTPAPPWSNPITSGEGPERLDDMQHAAYNSRGIFLNAKNPQSLIDSFTATFVDIDDRTSFSGSSVAINSTVLRTSSLLFTAQFDSSDYSGKLSAFTLNDDGTLGSEAWEASTNIPPAANRDIFTIVDKAGTPTAIEFINSDADLVSAVGSANIIDYIRGDQSNELQNGGTFRDRTSLLADIVQSSPVSAGGDDLFLDILPGSEGTTYANYIRTKTARFVDSGELFSVVYVGTNGGTMQAFDSRNGSELFGYVPQVLQGELSDLTAPDYGHKFYVNSTGSVNDAYINTGTGNRWHTIYTSALGEGGRAIFTLDITDPFNATSSSVMWEKDNSDYPELGFIKQKPRIARLNNGDWAIIVGNGYNSDSEKAQLLILDAQDGSLIAQIDTDTGGTGTTSPGITNGLAEPFLLDTNGDRVVDFAYAGDLLGNVWKFDLTDTTASNWDVAFSGNPLYTATDDKGTASAADDTPQPITTTPVIVRHPDGGFMVLFGTGKYLEASDKVVAANPDVNTFYGIRDNGLAVGSRNDLEEQEIVDEFDVTNVDGDFLNRVRIVSENTVDYTSKEGWFIDLITPPSTEEGERVIGNPLTRFGRAIFSTFIPSDSPCDVGGDSTIMELDAITGARLQNSVFDLNNDGVIDASDFVNYNGNDVPGSGIFIPATTSSATLIAGAAGGNDFKLTAASDATEGITSTANSSEGLLTGRQAWQQIR